MGYGVDTITQRKFFDEKLRGLRHGRGSGGVCHFFRSEQYQEVFLGGTAVGHVVGAIFSDF